MHYRYLSLGPAAARKQRHGPSPSTTAPGGSPRAGPSLDAAGRACRCAVLQTWKVNTAPPTTHHPTSSQLPPACPSELRPVVSSDTSTFTRDTSITIREVSEALRRQVLCPQSPCQTDNPASPALEFPRASYGRWSTVASAVDAGRFATRFCPRPGARTFFDNGPLLSQACSRPDDRSAQRQRQRGFRPFDAKQHVESRYRHA